MLVSVVLDLVFFSTTTKPGDWLGRTSPKCPIACQSMDVLRAWLRRVVDSLRVSQCMGRAP